jgi:hypothetical protein
MKAAGFVKDRANHSGSTSTSCGPDSFLGFFRTLMDGKPSLTLELDQHTADVGIDTHRGRARHHGLTPAATDAAVERAPAFMPARIESGPSPSVIASNGRRLGL